MEWRDVHIGFEGDDLLIGGLQVWKETWRPLNQEPLELPHPAYRHQRHLYFLYQIGVGAEARTFAVSELSNGVWGFYVPVATA